MNYRSLALAIAALSSAHITTAAAQSVYVAPGGVYIGGGPVYVIPAPSNGNGTYVEPTYGYGLRTVPRTHAIPGADSGGTGRRLCGGGTLRPERKRLRLRLSATARPPPAYYNGDPVLSAYGRARLYDLRRGRRQRSPTTATDAASPAVATASGAAIEKQPLLTCCRATPRDARVPGRFALPRQIAGLA